MPRAKKPKEIGILCPHCKARHVDYKGMTIVIPSNEALPYILRDGKREKINATMVFNVVDPKVLSSE